MTEINGGRGEGCCCFCNGHDNGYADDDCNRNNDDDDWLLVASPSWGREGRGRRIDLASIGPRSCQGVWVGRGDLGAATTRRSWDCQGSLPLPPLPRAAREGEGAGCISRRRSLGVTVMAMAIVTVWGEKGLDKGGERGNWKMGLILFIVFHFWRRGERLYYAVLFCYWFCGLPFSMQVNWFHIKFK